MPDDGPIARCAVDPVEFGRAVGFYADAQQQQLLRGLPGRTRRRIVCCTRQWGKSTTAAVLAAHRATVMPSTTVLVVAPSQRQSSLLFEKIDWFVREYRGGPSRTEDNRTQLRLTNGSRVVTLPDSPDTIRGYTPNLVLIDEAAYVSDATYGAVMPMLIASRGDLVLMSSAYGKRGEFYRVWTEGGDEWHRIKVQATECARIDRADLEAERATMPSWLFAQEYMCEFIETLDAVFTDAAIDGVAQPGEALDLP